MKKRCLMLILQLPGSETFRGLSAAGGRVPRLHAGLTDGSPAWRAARGTEDLVAEQRVADRRRRCPDGNVTPDRRRAAAWPPVAAAGASCGGSIACGNRAAHPAGPKLPPSRHHQRQQIDRLRLADRDRRAPTRGICSARAAATFGRCAPRRMNVPWMLPASGRKRLQSC
jgi:hypothetical protein